MGYLFLALAIVGEVVATSFLRVASVGEGSKWWAWAVVVLGYVFAFTMLSFTLNTGVPLAIAYAVWAAVGVVMVAVVSVLIFKEGLSPVQYIGMALVVGGVIMLEVGGSHTAATP